MNNVLNVIECDLVMTEKAQEQVIDSTTIFTSTRIQANEVKKLYFTFQMPDTVPGTTADLSYKLKTRIIFNKGVESKKQENIYLVT